VPQFKEPPPATGSLGRSELVMAVCRTFGGGLILALVLGAVSPATTKLRRYELNGQTFSYSDRNPRQRAEARQRIEAANRASAARAQAEAEVRANPLARIFGSQTQRQAADAEAEVRDLLAKGTQPETARPMRVRSRPGATSREPSRHTAAQERQGDPALSLDPSSVQAQPVSQQPGTVRPKLERNDSLEEFVLRVRKEPDPARPTAGPGPMSGTGQPH
jgi:hypothetical protein